MPIQPTVLHPENSADTDLYPRTNASQVTDFLDKTYPIGSVYMSIESTSPASMFGGTWTAIKSGFLASVGYSGITAGSTGGNASHNHGLSDGHANILLYLEGTTQYLYYHRKAATFTPEKRIQLSDMASDFSVERNFATELGGTCNTTTVLPPYYGVYMWRRVA